MAVPKIANRLGRYGRGNPGRHHLAGEDVTSTMQRQYEHILASFRASGRYRSDAQRKQVAAATVRALAENPELSGQHYENIVRLPAVTDEDERRAEEITHKIRSAGMAATFAYKEDRQGRPRYDLYTNASKRFVERLTAIQNPGDDSAAEAERLAEEFHGRPARDVIDVVERENYDTHMPVLGYLVELGILSEDGQGEYPIRFPYDIEEPESNIHLVSNAKGTHIDFIGGDQSFDWWNVPGASGDDEKYFVYVGPLNEIVYWADKHHLSGPKQQKSGMEYFHEWEEIPYLVYDQRNVKLLLVGGKYTIQPEGITG